MSTIWLALYLKIKKKPIKEGVKKHLKTILWFNGFIRLYFEILLDGILYVLINLRSQKFINFTMDIFSYLFMAGFTFFVMAFTIFKVYYIKKTPTSKWKDSLKEILIETNHKSPGIMVYHLTFLIRRLILSINAVMFGALGGNAHISIHFFCQLFTFGLMTWFPIFESKFQKVSNLIMEGSIVYVFGAAYVLHNTQHPNLTKNLVIAVIFLSQMSVLLMTLSMSIKELVIKAKKKHEEKMKLLNTEKAITIIQATKASLYDPKE